MVSKIHTENGLAPSASEQWILFSPIFFRGFAGVAALVWSLYPEKTNIEIRAALDYSAEDLGETGWDVDYGFGLVRADLAVAYLAGDPNSVPPELTISDTTWGQDSECVDDPPDWVDEDGDGCDVYADICFINGVAQEACCACGGGCSDSAGWVDSDGYGCDFYEQDNNCYFYGSFYESGGQTAFTACCACQQIIGTAIASFFESSPRRAGTGTVAASDRYVDQSGNIVSIPTSVGNAIGVRLVISVVVMAFLA